jgi:hypothetical protein
MLEEAAQYVKFLQLQIKVGSCKIVAPSQNLVSVRWNFTSIQNLFVVRSCWARMICGCLLRSPTTESTLVSTSRYLHHNNDLRRYVKIEDDVDSFVFVFCLLLFNSFFERSITGFHWNKRRAITESLFSYLTQDAPHLFCLGLSNRVLATPEYNRMWFIWNYNHNQVIYWLGWGRGWQQQVLFLNSYVRFNVKGQSVTTNNFYSPATGLLEK